MRSAWIVLVPSRGHEIILCMTAFLRPFFRKSIVLGSLLILGACSAILRNPVPADVYEQTTIFDQHDLRVWGDEKDPRQYPVLTTASPELMHEQFGEIMHKEHHYLAISGGGANGAYGAGVLAGWSALGTRPQFTMVTGVSTGALTAPFAFLGPDYDDELKLLYTTLNSTSIFFRRSIFSLIQGDSITDNTPLQKMLEQYVTDEMIAEIAAESRKGRVLSIGTTNLDANRPVIWDIGRIANSGDPRAGDLIRQILLASASIPGVFPPAYIQVQSPDGKTYDEMHVDGGTSAQMFLYPARLNYADLKKALEIKGTPKAYVIRNSRIHTTYDPVQARLRNIASKSVASLIRTQGIGDAYRIAVTTRRDGIDLELTWIPTDAPEDPGNEMFDPKYMSKLFEFGYQRTIDGAAWSHIDIDKIDPTTED